MKIHVIIPTYNRPQMLNRLLGNIERDQKGFDITIYMYNDHSTLDYSIDFPNLNIRYYKAPKNHGKKMYWKLVNRMFKDVRHSDADYFFMLADDDILLKNFFSRVIKQWSAITNDKKICLIPYIPKHRKGVPCWTKKEQLLINFGGYQIWNCGFVDMRFICERKFFEALGFRINPIPLDRWRKRPVSGSGVGQQISVRLVERHNLYLCDEDLVYQVPHNSLMNPQAEHLRK